MNETIQNKAKKQKGGFFRMFPGTLGTSLLGNLLTGKGMKAKIPGRRVMGAGDSFIIIKTRAVEVTIRTGHDF